MEDFEQCRRLKFRAGVSAVIENNGLESEGWCMLVDWTPSHSHECLTTPFG